MNAPHMTSRVTLNGRTWDVWAVYGPHDARRLVVQDRRTGYRLAEGSPLHEEIVSHLAGSTPPRKGLAS